MVTPGITAVVTPGENDSGESEPQAVPEISKHRIIEQIGRGGMGTVHRARQDSLERDVAVKVVDASDGSIGNLERFAREARVLALLDHPNIVPVYDYGTDSNGRRAYTMKLVRGRTLQAILNSLSSGEEKTSLQRLLLVFRKVCDAVGFAHSRGIIHRDLKPDNIMVGEFGEVLVMDWGLAAGLSAAPSERLTASSTARLARSQMVRPPVSLRSGSIRDSSLTVEGEVLGTPQYMSPEQATGTVNIDARTDVYALGGILYAILTLRPPVPRGEFYEVIDQVRQGSIEPFEENPNRLSRTDLWRVPTALLAVVRKAMALDREDRFKSVRGLATDVDAYLGGFATSAENVSLAGQLWLLVKRHRAFSIVSLLMLVMSVVFVVRLIASEQRANENERTARASETAAVNAGELSRRNEKAAREALAHARILQAESAYAANDTPQMHEALDAVPADLRDTQWQYLTARTDDRAALLAWEGDSFLIGSTPHPSKPGVFTVATNARTHRIVEFDAATGAVVNSFPFDGGWVRTLAYSPDASRLAIGRIQEGGISIHDAIDGKVLLQWKSPWVSGLSYLADGTRLLQSHNLGCVLWDAMTGRRLWESSVGQNHLPLPGGKQWISIDPSNLRIHSAEDGAVVQTYPVQRAIPRTMSVNSDGTQVVLAHEDGRITGTRLADGSTIFSTTAGDDGDIRRTSFTPDGRRIVTVAALEESGQTIQILDAATGRQLRRLRGGMGGVESMCIHPQSNHLLITSDGSATWALPESRAPSWTLEPGILGGFLGGNDSILATHPSAPIGVVSLDNGSLLWKPSRPFTDQAATDFRGETGAAQLSYSKTGGFEYRVFRALNGDAASTKELCKFHFPAAACKVAVNCDGTRTVVATTWVGIAAFQNDTGETLPQLDTESLAYVQDLAWHGSDPRKLIGVFSRFARRGNPKAEEWIVTWDVTTGQRVAQMRHPSALNCLATEPNGTRFAEGGNDKLVRIRDAETLEVQSYFRAHDNPINTVEWNPVLPIVATSGTDRAIRLWDVKTGRMIEEVHIGLREATALRWSPNGRRLAASSPGAHTLVWDFPELAKDLEATRKESGK